MEKIYISYETAIATKQAINEAAKDGFLYDSLNVCEFGPLKAAWIEVLEPTTAASLFSLGFRACSQLRNNLDK